MLASIKAKIRGRLPQQNRRTQKRLVSMAKNYRRHRNVDGKPVIDSKVQLWIVHDHIRDGQIATVVARYCLEAACALGDLANVKWLQKNILFGPFELERYAQPAATYGHRDILDELLCWHRVIRSTKESKG